MASVALVGFAPDTRNEVRDSTAGEVWSLNMLHSSPVMRKAFPLNVTRLFELHPKWMLQTKWYSQSGNHWDWLTRVKHHYPIYLIEDYPEIHNGVVYPLDAICNRYLSRIWCGDERRKYFTSSFCYMVALAIFQGFDRLEVYGFDCASSTEYVYQKAASEFWLGIASQYADIYLAKNSQLLRSKLYGFEGGQLIPGETIEQYKNWYMQSYDSIAEQTPQTWIYAQLLNGAISLCDEIKAGGETISRQILEGYKDKFSHKAHKFQMEINWYNAKATDLKSRGEDIDPMFRQSWERMKYLYRYDGALQLTNKLIDECDLQSPPRELDNRFKWAEFSQVI